MTKKKSGDKKRLKYKRLKLSSHTLNEITIKPEVAEGKLLFDKNDEEHRYIVDGK